MAIQEIIQYINPADPTRRQSIAIASNLQPKWRELRRDWNQIKREGGMKIEDHVFVPFDTKNVRDIVSIVTLCLTRPNSLRRDNKQLEVDILGHNIPLNLYPSLTRARNLYGASIALAHAKQAIREGNTLYDLLDSRTNAMWLKRVGFEIYIAYPGYDRWNDVQAQYDEWQNLHNTPEGIAQAAIDKEFPLAAVRFLQDKQQKKTKQRRQLPLK